MFELLQQRVDAVAAAYFREAPPPEAVAQRLGAAGCRVQHVGEAEERQLRLSHAEWGECDIVAIGECHWPMDQIARLSPGLSEQERETAGEARFEVVMHLRGQREDVLYDRKRLLWFMRRVLGAEGLYGMDITSTRLWSSEALDDELSHDAPLDVEGLFGVHAVGEALDPAAEGDDAEPPRAHWVHTHGLAQLGGFDFDLLMPSPAVAGDPMRSLAYHVLEQRAEPDGQPVVVGAPGGLVRFVSAGRFHERAAQKWTSLRENDVDHSVDRAIVCDAPGMLGRLLNRPPRPSRFFQRDDLDRCVIGFSTEAGALMAERARMTLPMLRHIRQELEEFEFPTLVKLAIPTARNESEEHIWFEVHDLADGHVDATCLNRPDDVPGLHEGDRRTHDLAQLSDWAIQTPFGQINPRSTDIAREIRKDPDRFREIMNLATYMNSLVGIPSP